MVVWVRSLARIGTGFVYVAARGPRLSGPLTPALRNEGAAIFSLTRNLGSSIGISVVNTLLTRNTQIMHSTLGEHVTRYSPMLRAELPGGGSPELAHLGGTERNRHGAGVHDRLQHDFKLMMVLSLAAIPLVFLLRKARGVAEPVHVE